MATKVNFDATITFYFDGGDSISVEGQEFYSSPHQGSYDTITNAFYQSLVVSFEDTWTTGRVDRKSINMGTVAACVCERTSVKEDSGRRVQLAFEKMSLYFSVKEQNSAGVQSSFREAVAHNKLFVLTDGVRKTMFADQKKIKYLNG